MSDDPARSPLDRALDAERDKGAPAEVRGEGWRERIHTRQVGPVGAPPRFDAPPAAGALAELRVWRGLAVADWDLDGDLDLAVSANDDRTALLVAEGAPRGRWLRVELEGKAPNRDAIGARVRIEVPGGRVFVREVRAGDSYLSQSELPLTFGLGAVAAGRVRVTVRWPGGETARYDGVSVDRAVRVVEGSGIRSPLSARKPRTP